MLVSCWSTMSRSRAVSWALGKAFGSEEAVWRGCCLEGGQGELMGPLGDEASFFPKVPVGG